MKERYYFNLWRNRVMYIRYDRWCEIQEEEHQETEFARKNNMEGIHWCWNCDLIYALFRD